MSRLRLPESGLAADLLGPPPPAVLPSRGPERLFAFADRLARGESRAEEAAEDPETWVAVALAGEVYALPVSHVQEILRVDRVTRVPKAPRPVRGITNFRGRVLVVLDTRLRLGLKRAETDGASRILVVQARGRSIGLLVDAVQQVVRLLPSQVQPPPAEVMTERSAYVTGVYRLGPTLLVLLDPERLLLLDSNGAPQPAPQRG
ncbi:MAG TPA: chemotaxis protein CheW [Thermoanaerobaculia bacterium]|nr:chemotaxis protein CheW [Thermoanaerobaculia bacterium]